MLLSTTLQFPTHALTSHTHHTRTHVRTEDSDTPILAAVLPGPSHYASATIEAIVDSELNCSQPLHTASTPIGGVEPAGHGQLSLNGQRPLTDEWAGKAQLDKPCTSQTRVVDADVVE